MPGDRYIVEGVLKVQPGIKVSPVSVDAASRQADDSASSEKEQGKEAA